jgi:hypothetical protein
MVLRTAIALTALVISVTAIVDHAGAQYVPMYGQPPRPYAAIPYGQMPGPAETHPNYGSFPHEDQPETEPKVLPPEFQRQLVHYQATEATGTTLSIRRIHTFTWFSAMAGLCGMVLASAARGSHGPARSALLAWSNGRIGIRRQK